MSVLFFFFLWTTKHQFVGQIKIVRIFMVMSTLLYSAELWPLSDTQKKTRSSAIAGRPCDAKACQG